MGAILTVDNVRHRRGGREVLRVEHLQVAAGERLGLLGLNGAGKTTLLRLLAGIDEPTAGEIRIDGTAPGLLPLGDAVGARSAAGEGAARSAVAPPKLRAP